ncbi:CAP domain-containing protein [Treponema sp. OMZ 787]|uniref:CAP domain-containing protein n=1 Tax=Treponema sp. OMZ 787 TaxID=2563669 RepID=UPI0020A34962|nr:CAP domain-containing protein [Treponema sp. OMZ 787]UTC63081.1 CAP domain-containing protein [Treponema sp. OMZ 787]
MKNKLCIIWLFTAIILLGSCESLFSQLKENNVQQAPASGISTSGKNELPIINEILMELNRVRSNPQRYAEEELKPRLKLFDGKLYKVPAEIPILTNEGTTPLKECINVLMKTKPMGNLELEKGLSLAAQWLADDQAKTGKIGHYGSDGSSPFDRMNRYGKWLITAGENCAYGPKTGKEIVAHLLIDDGVPDRGHRINILKKEFKKVGIGYNDTGKAPYGAVSVMDFAGGYVSK